MLYYSYLIFLWHFLLPQEPIEFKEVQIKCVKTSGYNTTPKWVIRNQADYERLVKKVDDELHKKYTDCEKYSLPLMDFSKSTLLGFMIACGGCSDPEYTPSVFYNKERNLYTFWVRVKQNGPCKQLYSKIFWITIPKIPANAKVDFKEETIVQGG